VAALSRVRPLGAGLTGALAMQVWWWLVPPGLGQVIEDRLLSQVPGALFATLLDRLAFAGEAAGGAIVAGFVVYGIVTGLALPLSALVAPRAPEFSASRRRMLGGVLTGGLAVLTAGGAIDTIAHIGERGSGPLGAAAAVVPTLPRSARAAVGDRAVPTASQVSPPGGLTPAITPVNSFYVVSKNFVDPVVNAANWTLEVGGPLTASPLRLGYDDLKAMPAVSQYVTLECISNDVGGQLISNAYWTGVPLKVLLEQAAMQPGAQAVAFTCVDGYTESLPIAQALLPTTIVAHTMNGQPLPDKHGFPARIITTGLYGMKNPKWLRSIQPVAQAPLGYWEQQGWAALAPVTTMSRIDVPASGAAVSGTVTFGGIAFAGNRGIRQVELSFDGGTTWLPARLERALGPDTWVLWYGGFQFAGPGTVTALVRATDGTGAVQTPQNADSFPAGAAGYATAQFRVSG
jgi:DMSO/TMAO reductase YedYZ molybdopterin-dependent catalytic subunit